METARCHGKNMAWESKDLDSNLDAQFMSVEPWASVYR